MITFDNCEVANEILDRLAVFDPLMNVEIVDPKDADLALKVARLEGWRHKDDPLPQPSGFDNLYDRILFLERDKVITPAQRDELLDLVRCIREEAQS